MLERGGAAARHRAHDVALGQDAEHGLVGAADDDGADPLLGQRASGVGKRPARLDRQDVPPLRHENVLDVHRFPPLVPAPRRGLLLDHSGKARAGWQVSRRQRYRSRDAEHVRLAAVEPGKQQQPDDEAADVGLPGDGRVGDAERRGGEPEQEVRREPDEEEHRGAAVSQQLGDALPRPLMGFADPARAGRRVPCGAKTKRAAAAIQPEIAAEAPTIGATLKGSVTTWAAAPATAQAAPRRRKRQAPQRRATGVPKAASQTAFRSTCPQEPCRTA